MPSVAKYCTKSGPNTRSYHRRTTPASRALDESPRGFPNVWLVQQSFPIPYVAEMRGNNPNDLSSAQLVQDWVVSIASHRRLRHFSLSGFRRLDKLSLLPLRVFNNPSWSCARSKVVERVSRPSLRCVGAASTQASQRSTHVTRGSTCAAFLVGAVRGVHTSGFTVQVNVPRLRSLVRLAPSSAGPAGLPGSSSDLVLSMRMDAFARWPPTSY
jgi:hypothetical protein